MLPVPRAAEIAQMACPVGPRRHRSLVKDHPHPGPTVPPSPSTLRNPHNRSTDLCNPNLCSTHLCSPNLCNPHLCNPNLCNTHLCHPHFHNFRSLAAPFPSIPLIHTVEPLEAEVAQESSGPGASSDARIPSLSGPGTSILTWLLHQPPLFTV